MKTKYLFLMAIAILLHSSCSKKTQEVTRTIKTTETTTDERDNLVPWSYKDAINPKLSDAQVKLVQFYVSDQFSMTRTTSHTTGSPEGGKLKKETREVEEIQNIDINLKGEAVFIQRDRYGNIYRMLVSFDSTDYTYSVWFRKRMDGFFYLEVGEITYKRGEKYIITSPLNCQLLFDPDEKNVKILIRRKAKGNTVQD